MQQIVDDQIIQVAIQYKIDIDSNMFPSNQNSTCYGRNNKKKEGFNSYYQIWEQNANLNNYLLGLSLNNGAYPNIDIDPMDPIVIKFHHDNTQVRVFILMVNILR